MTRATADASEVLAALAGRTDRAAARMAGVSDTAMRSWRRTGRAAPHTLAMAMQRLDMNPIDTVGMVDVVCTRNSSGWIIDAYDLDGEPAGGRHVHAVNMAHYPTLEAAHVTARRRYGRRIHTITPELNP